MDGTRTDQIHDVRLVNESQQSLKQLPGFQKHHRIPTAIGNSDRQFLAEIVAPQLDDDLQEKFAALRSAFEFKRKEISVSGPVDGVGIIETPFFNYEIAVTFLESDPAKTIWRRSVGEIRQPDQIFSQAFIKVFGNQFSILEVATANDLDLEAIVDHIEDAESDTFSVDYDKDVTWCEIQITNNHAVVRLDGETVRVISRQAASPQQLLATFVEIQQQFIATLNCKSSPFLMGSH